jgi:Iron-sulfur cluster assembly accessory protein
MGAVRPLKIMSLSDAAAERVKAIIANADRPIVGVRVGVKNGGCAGMEYTMEYAEEIKPGDEVIEDKGVTILVDPKAVLFLLGTEMDYRVDKLSAQFVFNNPTRRLPAGAANLSPSRRRGRSSSQASDCAARTI